jgi:glycosyltransferase involved in cell wall biosynthesis
VQLSKLRGVSKYKEEVPRRPRLVVFDMAVSSTSPAGSCVMRQLMGLASEYEVTLFSSVCDAQLMKALKFVRVWLPNRPLFLRYWIFQIAANLKYRAWLTRNAPPDFIQTTQGQYVGADVVYAHFCHRAYLKGPWKTSPVQGVQRAFRWINHAFNSKTEGGAIRRAKAIVVPSEGLSKELRKTYPEAGSKITVLANPVDCVAFEASGEFDSKAFRQEWNLDPNRCVFAFMALGDFARKGLDIIFGALASLELEVRDKCQVLVIGGKSSEIDAYKSKAVALGIEGHVVFSGFHSDPKPFLWASDVFCFPSAYEIFSLAILQAAAAGLPVIVPHGLYGAEEFVIDGENGWLIERDTKDLARVMKLAIVMGNGRTSISQSAQNTVRRYGLDAFSKKWSQFYRTLGMSPSKQPS